MGMPSLWKWLSSRRSTHPLQGMLTRMGADEMNRFLDELRKYFIRDMENGASHSVDWFLIMFSSITATVVVSLIINDPDAVFDEASFSGLITMSGVLTIWGFIHMSKLRSLEGIWFISGLMATVSIFSESPNLLVAGIVIIIIYFAAGVALIINHEWRQTKWRKQRLRKYRKRWNRG